MSLERADRIKETTTTTGTGTVNLGGAVTGFQTFVSQITSGATVRYFIETADLSEWEVGEGIFTDATPDTLSRVTVYASSNSGSLVDFSAGTKNVALSLTALDVLPPYRLAEGQMLNGRILPSVTSDDLTVALKTLAGTDPSASDPVYVMIGGTLRTITSALSVTISAAVNTFNAGSTELATEEIDQFAYLGYNATDGVVIGSSRIPFANLYSDFSATATNEKYCAISTITNAAAGDNYVNIGRFAATLSAGAGYTWSVPTFTAKNLIQKPIYETRWLDWTPTFTGFSADPATNVNHYKIKNDTLWINHREAANGTSNATSFTITFPFAQKTVTNFAIAYTIQSYDGGSSQAIPGLLTLASNSATATLYKDCSGANWTSSGNKRAPGIHLFYEI